MKYKNTGIIALYIFLALILTSYILGINNLSIKDDIVYINMKIDNPVANLELLKSPDARKLGILVESLKIINN